MIFDKIKNANKYRTKYPELNKALEILENYNFDSLKLGITNINESIKIVKRNYIEKFQNIDFGEIHKDHVDIHIYAGQSNELFHFEEDPIWKKEDILEESVENDVIFVKTKKPENYIVLDEGKFALFFPGELHCPLIMDKNLKEITKVIIKVKIS
ncbi:uncharacterized protein, YhcH/YjgK/YiaL family [Mycoplasmopsis canis UFG4]|uniref:Uncharacterized protein, YhcH/YjgK/YiaL family n=1 Tax=Mycoplasmopsis canis UFG4 TaxID=1131455 RepID=I1A5Z3_9BACT|nr:YhcH/YjgK/YiaL family protein [Mycoplasmopsis canis]EIE41914.1 uncharacterized protein, YhcH/YjgK/YiaL family [Mycoplasmopsis canis UFG4]